jgi:hypothetical protein
MNENNFEERFDRLEKTVSEGIARVDECFAQVTSRMEVGFAHVNGLVETIANTCAREFASIAEHFTQVDGRLEDIEGKIESFAHRGTSRARNVTSSPSASPNLRSRFDHISHPPPVPSVDALSLLSRFFAQPEMPTDALYQSLQTK